MAAATTGAGATVQTGRTWAAAGVGAGLAAVAGIQLQLRMDAVVDPAIGADVAAIVARMQSQVPLVVAVHVCLVTSALLLLPFAAGLRRRLAGALPADSLLPSVAWGGLVVLAAVGVLGTGLTTETIFGVGEPERMTGSTLVVFAHWMATIPYLWVTAGAAAVAVAAAALRHGAVPRWIGWASAGLGGLTLVAGVSPLQYLAGLVGPVWLVVVALGFAVGDRRDGR